MCAPKLRIIQTLGSVCDKIDVDTATERGVVVCTCVGENAYRVAEHTGQELAKMAKPFAMKVLAIKRQKQEELKNKFELDFIGGPESLGYVLSMSDFVVISAVLNKETAGIIGEYQISKMKQGAFLINISRGGIVDEAALIAALRSGQLAGAGLDVFEKEPIDPESPPPETRKCGAYSSCWRKDLES